MADGVLLAWAVDQLAPGQNELIDQAIVLEPAAAERRLGSLWSRRLNDPLSAVRTALQARFDARAPERVEALRQRAQESADNLRDLLQQPPAQVTNDLRIAEARLLDAVRARPFDQKLSSLAISSALDGTVFYGEARRFEDLERWGAWLADLAEKSPEDSAVQLGEAKGAVNAMGGYGSAGRFEDLERWGARLADIARRCPTDAVQLEEAKGAFNAMNDYGSAERFKDLERWGARLADIARQCPTDAMRLTEAQGAFNAMHGYG